MLYQFSRSLYRELAPELTRDPRDRGCPNRERFLRACERSLERLATDRHYFARPARTLFRDVRSYFPVSSQLRVLQVIEGHMALAAEYVDRQALSGRSIDGSPLSCHASTRRGTACQRTPLAGARYCPSHAHLEDDLDVTAA